MLFARNLFRIILLVIIVLVLSFILCSCANKQESREEDISRIKQFMETSGQAVNDGDAQAQVARFTQDGIYMWPDHPSIQGREELLEFFTDRFLKVDVKLENRSEELKVFDGWAFERGTYTAEISPKAFDTLITVHGKYLSILQRQDDGNWLVSRRIRNQDHP